jgi:hypothetical protein
VLLRRLCLFWLALRSWQGLLLLRLLGRCKFLAWRLQSWGQLTIICYVKTEPLKMMPTGWITRCTGPPHSGQFLRGSSLKCCMRSKRMAHDSHSYSYKGIAVTRPPDAVTLRPILPQIPPRGNLAKACLSPPHAIENRDNRSRSCRGVALPGSVVDVVEGPRTCIDCDIAQLLLNSQQLVVLGHPI